MKIIIETEEDRTLWTQRLSDAETAMHKLRTGTAVVAVDTPDDKVQFQMANRAELDRYIADIRKALGICTSTRPRGRRVVFG